MKILVVDDDPDIVRLLKYFLEAKGRRPDGLHGGRSAGAL